MSRPKRILLRAMAAFYVFAGINHFRDPGFYLPMMPPYLPWHRELIWLSGVAEVGLGLAVLVPIGGRAEGLGIRNWVRLPFQAVLIAWAWWYTRESARE